MRFILNIVLFWQSSAAFFSQGLLSFFAIPSFANPFNALSSAGYIPNWQAMYLGGTLIVGALIAYESIVLKKNAGKLPESTLFSISSILETAWLLVSTAAIYYGHFIGLSKVVPMAYIIYSIFGWLYGFYLLRGQAQTIEEVEDKTMPTKYMDYSLSFSLVIMITSIAVFMDMLRQGMIVLSIN